MALQGLRTQVDALTWDKSQLETELRRLKDTKPDEAAALEREAVLRAEVEELTERANDVPRLELELREALDKLARLENEADSRDAQSELREARAGQQTAEGDVQVLQEGLEHEREKTAELERRCTDLEEALQKIRDESDLRHYRELEAERRRWNEREAELQEKLRAAEVPGSNDSLEKLRSKFETAEKAAIEERLKSEELDAQVKLLQAQLKRAGLGRARSLPTTETGVDTSIGAQPAGSRLTDTHTAAAESNSEPEPVRTNDVLAQALLSQQLPPIPKFTGVDRQLGAETFREWKEQFDMVATLGGWDGRAKLVNLTARLKGQAFGFYRSCTLQQRTNYETLTKELERRFMPVELPAVQAHLFHDRRQKPRESVDDFAQDLRRLFYRAYPRTQQGSPEAEDMGKTVLVNQFVNGLFPELKTKVTGKDGNLDKILTIARFEEAKLKDAASASRQSRPSGGGFPQPVFNKAVESQRQGSGPAPDGGRDWRQRGSRSQPPQRQAAPDRFKDKHCYACLQYGHLSKHCRFANARGQQEARGPLNRGPVNQSPTGNRIAAVVEGGVYLEQQDQAPPEIDCTLERVATTLHGLTAQGSPSSFPIGPTLQAQVELEGVTVTALLDTGSPVTIASFEFVLRALAAKRPSSQTKEDWKAEMKSRVEKSTVNLCNFGGGRLDVIGQMIVSITRGNYQTKAVILVQDKTPLNLLVGTDLLATLGFVLIEKQAGRSARELAGPTRWSTIDVETAPTNQENLKITA